MLADYDDHQLVIQAKGVDENYLTVSNLHKNLISGNYLDGTQNFIIVGNGVFNKLSLKLLDFEKPLKLSFFTGSKKTDLNSAIQTGSFYASGVFNFSSKDLLELAIFGNVVAFVGVLFGGYLNDKFSSKIIILTCIAVLTCTVVYGSLIAQTKTEFFYNVMLIC